MQGFSGTYSVNGTTLTLQPTTGNWETKEILGFDGSGRPIYPAIGEFNLTWELMSTTELKQLIDFQATVMSTGSCVVDLPKWGDADYLFYSYSGTYPNRPSVGEYFQGYVSNVTMKITGIRLP